MMPEFARMALLSSVAMGIVACAGPKPAPKPSTVTAVAAPASSSSTKSAAASETGATRVGDYRLEIRDGEEYYCRRQVATGSRLSSRQVCMTKAQMEASREANQETMRDMQAPLGSEGISINAGAGF